MNWKFWLAGFVVLALAIPAAFYFGSLDWSRSHSHYVKSLPVLSDTDDRGEFRIATSEYEYRVRVAGLQNSGEAVILLHGFPESSSMWEPLITPLADAGYRVLAFDQRGYSPGARPVDVADYEANILVRDVITMADTLGFEQFHLVGHDWGSGAGWLTVFAHAERIISWTAMAIPHFGAFNRAVLNDPEQRQRSAYFEMFKKPMLVEFLLTYNGQSRLKKMLAKTPKKLREEYLSILSEPGALTAALNWYRALDGSAVVTSGIWDVDVQTPTLFIWGTHDGVVARSSVVAQRSFIKGPYRELELDAGHGLIREKPEAVIEAVLTHLKKH
jgi:pimeloyl-ACP methyl ester carboxylesterase